MSGKTSRLARPSNAGVPGGGESKVGYCKPPKHSRYVKGQSGNPDGARRHKTKFVRVLVDQLNEAVTVISGNRKRKMTKYEVVVNNLVAAAMKGDQKACLKILEMVPAAEMKQHEQRRAVETAKPITAEDAAEKYRQLMGRR